MSQARLSTDINLSLDEVREHLSSLKKNEQSMAAEFVKITEAIKTLQALAPALKNRLLSMLKSTMSCQCFSW